MTGRPQEAWVRGGARRIAAGIAVGAVVLAGPLVACTDGDDGGAGGGAAPSAGGLTAPSAVAPSVTIALPPEEARQAATTYADLAYALYSDAVVGADEMRASIRSMITTPSEATLAAARQAWVNARARYGRTEVFRFYGGPIDDPETGPERRLNGWPVDPARIDATAGSPDGGIVNDGAGFPDITAEALVAANGDGASGVVTGWHAIELLLWGEDSRPDGPGGRPAADFTASPVGLRRSAYLAVLADLVVGDLASVRDQWHPESGAYRAAFLADPVAAVRNILQGMGRLSSAELATRRMAAVYESREPETEYARFSDNTLNDIVAAVEGVRLAYTADHPAVQGDSLSAVVARLAPDADADLRKQLDNNLAAAEALPAPFDQVVLAGDDDEDRAEGLDLIEDLHAQGQTIAALAATFGLEISLDG